jgi:hypothetical protein
VTKENNPVQFNGYLLKRRLSGTSAYCKSSTMKTQIKHNSTNPQKQKQVKTINKIGRIEQQERNTREKALNPEKIEIS